MTVGPAGESALLIHCPAAEDIVGPHRALLDRSARVGVPAHLTVSYPFTPIVALTADDHRRLELLFAAREPFTAVLASIGWFADTVLYVAPDDPGPFSRLTASVTAAFPNFRPYGGAHAEIVPHLTVGHDHPAEILRAAEREVLQRLPFAQRVDAVELWAGPALASALGPWHRVRSYRLGVS